MAREHRPRPLCTQAGDAVVAIHEHHLGPVATGLGLFEVAEGGQDHDVARGHEVGRGTVDADHTRARRADEGVGAEAVAVADVPDVDLLVLEDAGGLHQIGVDGDRTLVVEVGLGDGGTVDLAQEHASAHVGRPFFGRAPDRVRATATVDHPPPAGQPTSVGRLACPLASLAVQAP